MKISHCPRCRSDNLSDDEVLLNRFGNKNQKTVCINCRMEIEKFYTEDTGHTSPLYENLPKEFKFHFNRHV